MLFCVLPGAGVRGLFCQEPSGVYRYWGHFTIYELAVLRIRIILIRIQDLPKFRYGSGSRPNIDTDPDPGKNNTDPDKDPDKKEISTRKILKFDLKKR